MAQASLSCLAGNSSSSKGDPHTPGHHLLRFAQFTLKLRYASLWTGTGPSISFSAFEASMTLRCFVESSMLLGLCFSGFFVRGKMPRLLALREGSIAPFKLFDTPIHIKVS